MNEEIIKQIEAISSGKNPRKPLNEKEVATGLTAYYLNAESLLSDAWLLIQNKRFARAIALTTLALEELSKVHQMHDFYIDLQSKNLTKTEITKPWQELWKSFTKHGEKQKAVEVYGKASRDATNQDTVFGSDFLPYSNYLPEGLAANLDALKQKCFYVDYADTNFTEPQKLADIKIIDYLYSIALERLYSFGAWHGMFDRSLHFLKCKTNLINEPFDTDKNTEIIEKFLKIDFTPPSSEENIALQDFLYWLSHRTSSEIPDYSSFLAQGEKALSKLDKSGVYHVLSNLLEQIKEKLEVKEMPRTTGRHFKMMKLIISFSEMAVTKGLLRKRHFDAMFT